jgi:hypothetical protein
MSYYLRGLTNLCYLDANKVAEAFGYTAEQLDSVPDGAHMGLSCGNPVATATIKEVNLLLVTFISFIPPFYREKLLSILVPEAALISFWLLKRLDQLGKPLVLTIHP